MLLASTTERVSAHAPSGRRPYWRWSTPASRTEVRPTSRRLGDEDLTSKTNFRNSLQESSLEKLGYGFFDKEIILSAPPPHSKRGGLGLLLPSGRCCVWQCCVRWLEEGATPPSKTTGITRQKVVESVSSSGWFSRSNSSRKRDRPSSARLILLGDVPQRT